MIHCSNMLNIIFYDIKHDFRRETLNLDHKIYSRPSSSFIHPLLCYCCCKFMDIIMISYINFLSSEKGHFAEWNDIWTKRQLLFSMFSFILGCHWFFLYSIEYLWNENPVQFEVLTYYLISPAENIHIDIYLYKYAQTICISFLLHYKIYRYLYPFWNIGKL